MKRKALGLVVTLTLTACITVGKKFDVDAVDKLQPETSTTAQAVDLLGPVTSETSYPNGTKLLQWQYSQGTPVGGRGGHVAVLFDKDGRMIRLVQKTKITL